MAANIARDGGTRQPAEPRGLVLLFVVLLILIPAVPFLEQIRGGGVLIPLVGIAIPLAALRAVSTSRKHVIMALLLAVPSILVGVVEVAGAEATWAAILPRLAFFGFATWVIGREVFAREVVTAEVLAGAACVYLLLAITWWFAYLAAERLLPGSFVGLSGSGSEASRTDLMYFSFVTLTTLGYGDIVPVGAEVRALVAVQAVIGVLYPAVLIARLVGLYAGRRAGS